MADMNEMGRSGLNCFGGFISEEFLRELQGKRGIEIYKEMSENDDVVGAMLFAIKMLVRQAHWNVQPAGGKRMDTKCANFIESCLHDMSMTWNDTISEILSFLVYGWSAHEIVYKRRMGRNKDRRMDSKYNDGLIGWQKLPIRSQESLYKWEYNNDDELVAMTQMPAPSYKLITIPMEKLLLFRTESRKENPEGRSILRNAFRSWAFKKRLQEIEGIGVERDLAGFPVLIAPEGVNVWDASDPEMVRLRTSAERLITSIRRDSAEGIVIPSDWKLQLTSASGTRQFDTGKIIERYDSRIAMTVLADFVLLGHQQVGSFALSSDKTKLFSMAIGAYLDIIASIFNDVAIPKLIDINEERFNGITDYPMMVHGDIETQNLAELSTYIKDMTGIGVITPDSSLEDYVRQQAGLPEKIEDEYMRQQNSEEDEDADT